jgi:hypothetical protein
MSRIARHFEKSFGTGAEQESVEDFLFCSISGANRWGSVKTTFRSNAETAEVATLEVSPSEQIFLFGTRKLGLQGNSV